jgi:endoglucanase
MTKKFMISILLILIFGINLGYSKVAFSEIRTAADNVIVAFFISDTVNVDEIATADLSVWKINGQPAKSIHKYVMQASQCNHHIYLETEKLIEGKKYKVETPYGNQEFTFAEREIFCESIKTNQIGYSALSKVRYANFAIWLGTGGSRIIKGALPGYEVFETGSGKTIFKGKIIEIGEDVSSGGFVYRIDLAAVPEGGPYKIAVEGFWQFIPVWCGWRIFENAGAQAFQGTISATLRLSD